MLTGSWMCWGRCKCWRPTAAPTGQCRKVGRTPCCLMHPTGHPSQNPLTVACRPRPSPGAGRHFIIWYSKGIASDHNLLWVSVSENSLVTTPRISKLVAGGGVCGHCHAPNPILREFAARLPRAFVFWCKGTNKFVKYLKMLLTLTFCIPVYLLRESSNKVRYTAI